MKNKIKIIPWCRQYSIIEVEKLGILSEHIVSNNGWLDLEYWIFYFKNEY